MLAGCSSSKKADKKASGSTGTANSAGSSGGSSAPAGGAPTCSSGTLNAEGSTAQTNAIKAWISAYDKACSGATVNYNPTGSGAGVTAFTGNQVDFAGSD
ncbi:MAG: phosphate ABC transporter substrate-binding protein PstS, partial [Pseudonocardiales bacterium]